MPTSRRSFLKTSLSASVAAIARSVAVAALARRVVEHADLMAGIDRHHEVIARGRPA